MSFQVFTSEDKEKRIGDVRKVYHRALRIPLCNLDKLLSEYLLFENLNNGMIDDSLLRKCDLARDALRTLNGFTSQHFASFDEHGARVLEISLPTRPTYTYNERTELEQWRAYLRWEESDPLGLAETDAQQLYLRVKIAYSKALEKLRYWPEIWFVSHYTG
jgi:cleavage stimulation factor subunit 3